MTRYNFILLRLASLALMGCVSTGSPGALAANTTPESEPDGYFGILDDGEYEQEAKPYKASDDKRAMWAQINPDPTLGGLTTAVQLKHAKTGHVEKKSPKAKKVVKTKEHKQAAAKA